MASYPAIPGRRRLHCHYWHKPLLDALFHARQKDLAAHQRAYSCFVRGKSCGCHEARLLRALCCATALVAHAGDASQYKNGRAFAASLGLTPKEHSSGGKQKLLGLTKRGNNTIRMLLIQGARIVIRYALAGSDGRYSVQKWLQGVVSRRGKHIAAVALANKTARIIWNLLAKKEEYHPAVA